jgi:hypothetical protein
MAKIRAQGKVRSISVTKLKKLLPEDFRIKHVDGTAGSNSVETIQRKVNSDWESIGHVLSKNSFIVKDIYSIFLYYEQDVVKDEELAPFIVISEKIGMALIISDPDKFKVHK